jgi:type IV secretion system protein VirB4
MNGTLQAAWLSMLPGGAAWRPRPGFVSSKNFCAFSPFYSWPKGDEEGYWPGGPIAIFRTLGGTPYRFHWHVSGDVGNTIVTGATGSGKTTLVGMLIAMTANRARIIGLDHKRGWQFLAQRLGADYAVAGRGEPLFAPLKMLAPTEQNIEFLIDLVRSCIGGRMTEEEGRRNALGIRTLMQRCPPEKRSLAELSAFFDTDPEGAGSRLEKWVWPTGELGWVIDAPMQRVRFGQVSFLDTTWLLANERARGPALACAFHYISLMLDGTPTLIACDETWQAFADPDFFAILEKEARTIRSKNGVMVFITQSPDEFAHRGKIIIEQCRTQFHLANRYANEDDYVKGFKFTKGQYEAFRGLPTGQGYFLLKQEDQSIIAQAPMGGMDRELAILSAREADLTADRIELMEAAE